MIFDSERIQRLRERYASIHPCEWPRILWVDREHYAWQTHLEAIIQSVPSELQKEWLKRLVNEDDTQYMGAWFEMMLFGWLRQVGDVTPQPEREGGSKPDFLLRVGKQEILVEAFVLMDSAEVRRQRAVVCRLVQTLETIPRPIGIDIEEIEFSSATFTTPIPWQQLKDTVTHWLDTKPDEPLEVVYPGCRLLLKSFYWPNLSSVAVIGPGEVKWVDVAPMRGRFQKKVKQHRKGWKHLPFVLAVFFDRWDYSPNEVVRAWFGNPQVTIDVEAREVVSQGIDFSGLHYFGREIRYTSISGTLAFHHGNMSMEPPFLVGAYVQNPYARHYIDPNIWPVRSRFVVVRESETGFEMGWRSGQEL